MSGMPITHSQSRKSGQVPYFDGAMFHERRAAARRPASGHLTGVVNDPHDPTRPGRICALELRNISATGFGAVSAEPLPTGARITTFAPPHGAEPPLDLRGTIVRCRELSGGYDIGVALSQPKHAA